MKKTYNEQPSRNKKIYKMYQQGKRISEIAKKHNVSTLLTQNIIDKEKAHEALKEKYSNIIFDKSPFTWQMFLAIVRAVNATLDRPSTEEDVIEFLYKPDEEILKGRGIGPKTLEAVVKWRKAYERKKNKRK